MPRSWSHVRRAFVCTLSLTLVTAFAADAADFSINWATIDGGGTLNSTGGTYSLSGTIGQPDTTVMSGGPYEIVGGFWSASTGAPCPEDIDGNGIVDINDLAVLLSEFGLFGTLAADIDNDGDVDINDLALILSAFGLPCSS